MNIFERIRYQKHVDNLRGEHKAQTATLKELEATRKELDAADAHEQAGNYIKAERIREQRAAIFEDYIIANIKGRENLWNTHRAEIIDLVVTRYMIHQTLCIQNLHLENLLPDDGFLFTREEFKNISNTTELERIAEEMVEEIEAEEIEALLDKHNFTLYRKETT